MALPLAGTLTVYHKFGCEQKEEKTIERENESPASKGWDAACRAEHAKRAYPQLAFCPTWMGLIARNARSTIRGLASGQKSFFSEVFLFFVLLNLSPMYY
jgi:hypothetical protein